MRFLDILSYLDFFENWGRSTPRGRGQSYKVSGKSELFQFFAKIVKIPRIDDYCNQSAQIFLQIGDDYP
jgi:hypothetical protein